MGALIDNRGKPVCCEMWPGNTTDVKTLIPVIDRIRSRFHIGQFCIVADRGMISSENLKELDNRDTPYIFGTRMRKVKEIKEEKNSIDISKDIIPKLIERGGKVYGYVSDLWWYDVGSIEKYEKLDNDELDKHFAFLFNDEAQINIKE